MRVLIVDQCSASKDVPRGAEVLSADAVRTQRAGDGEHPDPVVVPANRLYVGRQQQMVRRAVEILRDAGDEVTLVYISAGVGVVDETEAIPPYEATFAGLPRGDVRKLGDTLGITSDLVSLLRRPSEGWDLVVFTLGAAYWEAIDAETVLDAAGETSPMVGFNIEHIADGVPGMTSLSARLEEARELEEIVIALKGRYLLRFARNRRLDGEPGDHTERVQYFRRPADTQASFAGYDSESS